MIGERTTTATESVAPESGSSCARSSEQDTGDRRQATSNGRPEQPESDLAPLAAGSARTLPRGALLYIDCFSGIAGDMTLAALIDLGVPEEVVRRALATIPLAGYRLQVGRASRGGLSACHVKVEVEGMSEGETEAETETMVETMPETMAEAEHQDHAAQGPHGHRRYRELRELIAGAADLDQDTRQRALDIFDRLAAAEGRLHGVAPAEVSFHELGAIDSVVDIVGTAAALSYLAPSAVSARPVPLGTGSLRCAHGLLPVPSPAALELLRDAEVEGGDAATEITTPTGAAILAATATSYGPMPRMRVEAIGYGAGDMELPGRPNLLRLVAGLPALAPAAGQVESEPTLLVEANLDDMSPELAAPLLDRLLAVGAVDAWFVPAYMKKNRPGFVIAALAPEPAGERVCGVLLRESTTLGIRLREVERRLLGRTQVEVETAFGKVLVKLGLDQTDGGRVVNVAPELESCRRVAESCKVPLKQVYAAALVAYATDRPTGDGQ